MFTLVFGFLPFVICLSWLCVFALGYRRSDGARRAYTWFLAVAAMLYACHGIYFNFGNYRLFEGIWAMCSLSVYPLYLIYIYKLTDEHPDLSRVRWTLLPGAVVAVMLWMGFSEVGQIAHKLCFLVQVVEVCRIGWQQLSRFDQRLQQFYADTEEYETHHVRRLLVFFVCTSLCSSVFNIIGRQYFLDSKWLICIPSLLFGTLLFTLSYVCHRQNYAAQAMRVDKPEPSATAAPPEWLGSVLRHLMDDDHLYLRPNIRLDDLAREVGTCRTYLSTYINQELGLTFSEYINRQRITYAQQLLSSRSGKLSIDDIARLSGFASISSFYRNFQRFVGQKPEAWILQLQG